MNTIGNLRTKIIAAITTGLIFSATDLIPFTCLANDLPRADPDRKAILDAARQLDAENFPQEKFIVKSLIKNGDWAYLCALVEENGYKDYKGDWHESHGIQGTDDDLDVHKIILNRQKGHWTVLYNGGSLAPTMRDVDCRTDSGKVIQNADDIQDFLNSLPSDSQ